MAELADAYGSGPYERKFMQVQVLLPAPSKRQGLLALSLALCRGLEPEKGAGRQWRPSSAGLRSASVGPGRVRANVRDMYGTLARRLRAEKK